MREMQGKGGKDMFLKVENAVKIYGTGGAEVRALDGASLELDKGKICVVLGPSGSGKSTLLNMIGGIDTLDSGKIVIDGKNISEMNKKQLTEYRKDDIGFVFQFYNLINDLSAEENIQVVADICDHPLCIDEVMESLKIEELKNRFPKELSGGQQQRIAIARAMIKNPKILLCDELTGALDSHASKSVLMAIEQLNQIYKTTVFIITHNEAIAAMADKIIYIKDGKIIQNTENKNKRAVCEIEL